MQFRGDIPEIQIFILLDLLLLSHSLGSFVIGGDGRGRRRPSELQITLQPAEETKFLFLFSQSKLFSRATWTGEEESLDIPEVKDHFCCSPSDRLNSSKEGEV